MFKIILAVACAICLLSCNASKQAAKHFNKAVEKHKPTVAKLTREMFPCIETFADTVAVLDTVFDIIEVECPSNEYDPKVVYRDGKPTTVTKTVKVPVKVPVYIRETRTITKKIEDQAHIYTLEKATEKIAKENEQHKAGRDKWRTWCLITWALVGLAGAGLFFRKRLGL